MKNRKLLTSFIYCILVVCLGYYLYNEPRINNSNIINYNNDMSALNIYMLNIRTDLIYIFISFVGPICIIMITILLLSTGMDVHKIKLYHNIPIYKIVYGLSFHGVLEIICFSLIMYMAIDFSTFWYKYFFKNYTSSILEYYKNYITDKLPRIFIIINILLFVASIIEKYFSKPYFNLIFKK